MWIPKANYTAAFFAFLKPSYFSFQVTFQIWQNMLSPQFWLPKAEIHKTNPILVIS